MAKINVYKWAAIIAGLIVLCYLALIANRFTETKSEKKEQPVLISSMKIHYTAHQPRTIVYAKVTTNKLTKIRSRVSSHVTHIFAQQGKFAKKNALLIQLDNDNEKLRHSNLQAELTSLKSKISQTLARYQSEQHMLRLAKQEQHIAKQNLDRKRRLVKLDVYPRATLEVAQKQFLTQQKVVKRHQVSLSEYKNLLIQLNSSKVKIQNQIKQSNKQLAYTRITAPFNSRIVKVFVSDNDQVNPGEPILQLYPLTSLQLSAKVPLRYFNAIHSAIRNKQPITAYATLNEKKIPLNIATITGAIQPGDAGASIYFKIKDAQQHQLLLGQLLKTTIILPAIKNTAVIPSTAIYSQGNHAVVYRIVNHRLQAVQITKLGNVTDANNQQRIIITSKQLRNGDQILTNYLPAARPGMLVSVATPQ